jgi:hypothetical protein
MEREAMSLRYALRSIVEFVRSEEGVVAKDVFDFELPRNFQEYIKDGHIYVRVGARDLSDEWPAIGSGIHR